MSEEEKNNKKDKKIKTTKKTVRKKAVKKTKKTAKKKTAKKTKKTSPEQTPLQVFSDKTLKYFDTIIDEVKTLPKKTSDFSKNSQILDSLTQFVQKTKTEFIKKKDDFSKTHHLNSSIASNKRKLIQKYLLAGKKILELMEKSKISVPELSSFFNDVQKIKKEIKTNEAELKKIFKNK